MPWYEFFKIVGTVLVCIGGPISYIIHRWDKERIDNTNKIGKNSEELQSLKERTIRLEEGKVSHEQLRDTIKDTKEHFDHSIERLTTQWDSRRREDKEDLQKMFDNLYNKIEKR